MILYSSPSPAVLRIQTQNQICRRLSGFQSDSRRPASVLNSAKIDAKCLMKAKKFICKMHIYLCVLNFNTSENSGIIQCLVLRRDTYLGRSNVISREFKWLLKMKLHLTSEIFTLRFFSLSSLLLKKAGRMPISLLSDQLPCRFGILRFLACIYIVHFPICSSP